MTVASPDPSDGLDGSFRALRHRNYAIFWTAGLVSNTGLWISNVAVPFVIFAITGSAVWVGLIAVATFVPSVLLAPIGGLLADRFQRRHLLLITQALSAVAALLLWIIWVLGVRDPIVLLAPVAISGALTGINLPSWQSFVYDLVPRHDLRSAVALNSIQYNGARALGPVLAGVLLATVGPSLAFLINACSFVVVLVALGCIHPHNAQKLPTERLGPLAQLTSAVRYTAGHPGLIIVLIVSALIGVFGNPIFSLTVVLGEAVYGVGAFGVGLLNMALGIGAVAAAPFVSGWSRRISLGRAVTWGMYTFGVALIACALSAQYGLALVWLVLSGAGFMFAIVGVNTAMHLLVVDSMRGRVVSLRHVIYVAGFPVGSMLSGVIADAVGVQWALITCGAGLLCGILLLRLLPRFEKLNGLTPSD